MPSYLAGCLAGAPLLVSGRSRAITTENLTGAKGVGGKAASNLGAGRKGWVFLSVGSGETVVLAEFYGAGAFVLRDLVLRMYWDGEETQSVEVPLGDLFCTGIGRRCLVNSLPTVVAPTGGMNCYFPMPFHHSARVTVTSEHPADIRAFFYQYRLPRDRLGISDWLFVFRKRNYHRNSKKNSVRY